MSARRLKARAAALHEEVAKKELFTAQFDRRAARERLDAASHIPDERQLRQARLAAISHNSSTSWKDDTEEASTRSRRVMLEAHRACQRYEESVSKAAISARADRDAALRQAELQAALKEEAERVHGHEVQEQEEMRRQRHLTMLKRQSKLSFADDKARVRDQLLELQRQHENERDAVKQRVERDKKRSQERQEKARSRREQQMHDEISEERHARLAREERRTADAALEKARKKEGVALEAVEVQQKSLVVVERLQAKLAQMQVESQRYTAGDLLPVQEELKAAEARRDAAMERTAQAQAVAASAARDALQLKKKMRADDKESLRLASSSSPR